MQKPLAFGLVGALTVACCGLGISKPPPGQAYTLHFRPPVGRPLHYGMSMVMSGASTMTVTASFTLTTTAHTAGKYTVVTTIESMTAPGAPPDQIKKMLAGTKVTQTVDENGSILKTEAVGPMKDMMKQGSMGSTAGIFPKHPVHVGDTWVGTSSAVGGKQTVKVKLVGVKTADGKQVAVLQVSPTSQAKGAKTDPITAVIETASGVLHSMDMTGSMDQGTSGAKMRMSVKLR